MGGLRTLRFGVALGLLCLGQATASLAQTRPDPMPLFATCTGRLSALMEFQWLTADAGSDKTRARRDAMAELLAAVTPETLRVRAMQLRLEAKVAAADLLLRTWRQGDAAPATQALLAGCSELLLS